MPNTDRLCEGLSALLNGASAFLPINGLGVVLPEDAEHAVFTYGDALGAGAYRVRAGELPDALQFRASGLSRMTVADLEAISSTLIGIRLRRVGMDDERQPLGARQVLALPVPGIDPPAMLVVGMRDEAPLTAEQLARMESFAADARDLVNRPVPLETEVDRLRRLDAVDALLGELFRVLDVRDIFNRVSATAKRALPHEMLALGLFNDDASQVVVYAHTPSETDDPLPTVVANPHPLTLSRAWLYSIIDDLAAHPLERDGAAVRAGARASLNVAIWFDDRLFGGLSFYSRDAGRFTTTDIAVARRIAEYVALALSHQRLAEEGRRAAALQERAANLEMLDGLLQALTGVLSLREAFDRVSDIAQKVLPHDAIVVIVPTGDGNRAQNYALRGFPDTPLTVESRVREPDLLTEPWDSRIIDDLALHPAYEDSLAVRAGLHGALLLPVRMEGGLRAFLSFMSREPARFTRDDVLVGRRIADHVALALSHERLAEEGRRTAALQERAANLEMLDGLLKTLTGVLDVREVFDRVSEISEKVMTHDAMSISMPAGDGERLRIHVTTGALSHLATPFDMPLPNLDLFRRHWDHELIADLAADARYIGTPSAVAGMRAMLSIPVWVEGRFGAAVNFFSRTPGHFTNNDVQVGRRIADHVALALSHQRLAEEARRNEALRARTEKLELLDEVLASVTGARELPDVFDRVSNVTQKVLGHDALVLTALLPGGSKARVHASETRERVPWPEVVDVPPLMLAQPDWEFDLIDDLQARPDQRNLEATTRGYRAALRVPIRLDGEYVAGVSFLSVTAAQYSTADIPVARRIADRLALSFLRERRDDASRRADEATARASKLEARVRALTEELDARTGYRRVVGESASWRQVLTQATQVASTDTTVLLLGESGTGKEVVARFVHRASPRRDGPLIALNCAALPEQLLEAELFGYERGAFTGATQSKPGQLEQAGGGTLFLDEVGEMSPQVQAKFLRVLQEREFQRLGGTRVLRSDARIVAATNRDLQQAISQGQFREDLFYRLNVFAIHLPPLRDRRDDVLPLSEAFLAEYGRSLGRPPSGISRDARKRLMEYHWPGNVRELRNILERAAILCDGGLITADHLALTVMPAAPATKAAAIDHQPLAISHQPSAPAAPSGAADLHSMERAMIEQALQTARFNKSKAAEALGLTRAQLYVRMKRYGLDG